MVAAGRRRVRGQRRRLRDRPQARATALRARRPDPEEEVLRQHQRLLRQARQQGPGDRPLRAVRAHLHHRRRRRDADGAPPLLRLERDRRGGWVVRITLLGYFLGAAFPWLGNNIDYVTVAILAFTVVPLAYEWIKHRHHHDEHDAADARRPVAGRVRRVAGARPSPTDRRSAAQRRRRRASRSALVSTARTSRPTSASGFSPSGCGRSRTRRPRRSRRASRSACVASRTAPPVVITSSTRVTRLPAYVRTLGELAGAVGLGLLAHEQRRGAGDAADDRGDRDAAHLEAAEQVGVLRDELDHLAGDAGSRSGSDSKRYLSKYSSATWPERRVNSPRQAAAGVDVGGEGVVGGGHGRLSRPGRVAAVLASSRLHGHPADDLRRDVGARGAHRRRSTSARGSPTSTARRR